MGKHAEVLELTPPEANLEDAQDQHLFLKDAVC